MVFSVCDIDLLWLLSWCGNIQPTTLRGGFQNTTVRNLIDVGLVRQHKSSGSLALTKKGHQYLTVSNVLCPDYCLLSYRGDLLQRRLRIANITMTAYRAQLNLFAAELSELAQEYSLFLPHISRGRERNIWGSSRISAVFRLSDCCYGTYNVYPGIGRLNLEDEEKILSSCVSRSRSSNRAFFFAGDSYPSILTELERKNKENEGRLISYREMWERSSSPIHLLSCDDTGAVQLQIMAQPDYRIRLARAALKEEYQPPPLDVPVWDAIYQGQPLVIAADMDLRRLDAAVQAAHSRGLEQITVAALEKQAKTVLIPRYQDTGQARVFALTKEAITEVTGRPPVPYTPPHTQFLTEKGDVVDAPPIRIPGKAGGQAGGKVRPLV